MEQQVYRKQGRKYIPVGYSDGWSGFPSDGIWIVQGKTGSKSSECILKLGESESMQPAINLILGYKDKLMEALKSNPNISIHGTSLNDVTLSILKEISK